jgi:hypothetical protein
LSRVELAGVEARDEIRRYSEDALTSARLLASRPTLPRLLRAGQPEPLEFFVRRFCETGGLDVCAVVEDDVVLAAAPGRFRWDELAAPVAEQGERFLVALPSLPDGALGATAEFRNCQALRVVVLRTFDRRLAGAIGERVGMDVRLVRLSDWLDTVEPDFKELHSEALARGATNRPSRQEARRVRLEHAGDRRDGRGHRADRGAPAGGHGGQCRRSLRPAPRVDRGAADRPCAARDGAAGAAHRATAQVAVEVRGPARTWRLLDLDPRQRHARGRGARAHPRGDAPQPDRRHGDAAAARGRGTGAAAGSGRGRVRRGCPAQRPLRESAGGAHARRRARRGHRTLLWRCAATLRRRWAAALRVCLPDPGGPAGRQVAGNRGAGDLVGHAAHRRDHQRRTGGRPAGADHARRDRARGGASRARLHPRQHLARVPYPARGAAGLDRAAARRARRHAAREARGTGGLAAAGHAAADAPDRQPARERAHRVRAARDPPPAGRAGAGGGGCPGADRRAAGAAAPAAAGRDPRRTCRWCRAMRSDSRRS